MPRPRTSACPRRISTGTVASALATIAFSIAYSSRRGVNAGGELHRQLVDMGLLNEREVIAGHLVQFDVVAQPRPLVVSVHFPEGVDGRQVGRGGLDVNRRDVMEVRVIGWRLPLEGWRVLPGRPIDPFQTNG